MLFNWKNGWLGVVSRFDNLTTRSLSPPLLFYLNGVFGITAVNMKIYYSVRKMSNAENWKL